MLSLFPQILFLAPFSATLIRVALAVFLVYAAWRHCVRPTVADRVVGIVELAAGVLLFVGAWTQAAALLVFVMILAGYFFPRIRVYPTSTLFAGLVFCLSLLVTGPGVLAFDLPL